MQNKKEVNEEPHSDYEWDVPVAEPSKKESIFRKIFKGFGYGGLFIGGGIISIIFYILNFLFTALVGLSVIGIAIGLFMKGSILWGLLTLLIFTPLAIVLAHWLFFFLIILVILSAILWGIATILGFNISLWTAGDIIWLIIKILILGLMACVGIFGFIEAIRQKRILGFFKEYWWGILLFCFLFWLFFL